jgi:hypothetical protein
VRDTPRFVHGVFPILQRKVCYSSSDVAIIQAAIDDNMTLKRGLFTRFVAIVWTKEGTSFSVLRTRIARNLVGVAGGDGLKINANNKIT